MIRKIIYHFFLLGILVSCNCSNNQSSNNQNKQEEELDCEEIISKIVQSSSLDWKHYPEAFTRIDRISGDSIFIKVFFDMDITDENEPNTKQVVENTIAWLLLCVEDNKMYNITYNNSIQEIGFNKMLFDTKKIKEKCDINYNKEPNCTNYTDKKGNIKYICTFPNQEFEVLYDTLKIKYGLEDELLKKLPKKDTVYKIGEQSDIKYKISNDTIGIELFYYEIGGSTLYKLYKRNEKGIIDLTTNSF